MHYWRLLSFIMDTALRLKLQLVRSRYQLRLVLEHWVGSDRLLHITKFLNNIKIRLDRELNWFTLINYRGSCISPHILEYVMSRIYGVLDRLHQHALLLIMVGLAH